jgi:hypothetical protein
MIRDGQDRPMSPSHANKSVLNGTEGKRRYRYYVSNEAVPSDGAPGARAMRLPAKTAERAVLDAVSVMLEQAAPIRERWASLSRRTAESAERCCRALAGQLRGATVAKARPLLQLDLQIIVEEQRIVASCSLIRLLTMVAVTLDGIDRKLRVPIHVPTRIQRRGQALRLKVHPVAGTRASRDPHLIGLIVKAHDARRQLIELGVGAGDRLRHELTRIARLSYLAPDIIVAILDGRQPEDLGARRLVRIGGLPLCWNEQRRLLGFA